ncbi:MAG: DUF4395 domain-containing protein [Actinobacteria bacterium]|nr:DUF4395 domain-containing protein [Actinomycetota bacterium]NBO35164.1 DUF4395 domain-containing protein [Actinomycetota bacterium]
MSKQIDPRGPRFGAAITTGVLAIILLTIPSSVATALLVLQTAVFALGAFVGLHAQPYGILYRKLVAPKLGKPSALEAVEPPQFAQLVGFLFAATGLIALLLGADLVATIGVGFALGAAFLNAAFNFCLGCEMYLIGKRIFS